MRPLQPLSPEDYASLPASLQSLNDVTVGTDGKDIFVIHLPSGSLQARRMKRACEISLPAAGKVQLRSEHEDTVIALKQAYEDTMPKKEVPPQDEDNLNLFDDEGVEVGGLGPDDPVDDDTDDAAQTPAPVSSAAAKLKLVLKSRAPKPAAQTAPATSVAPAPEPEPPTEPPEPEQPELETAPEPEQAAQSLAPPPPPPTPDAPPIMGPGIVVGELRGIPADLLNASGLLITRTDEEANDLSILFEKPQLALAQKLQRICKIRMQKAPKLEEATAEQIGEMQLTAGTSQAGAATPSSPPIVPPTPAATQPEEPTTAAAEPPAAAAEPPPVAPTTPAVAAVAPETAEAVANLQPLAEQFRANLPAAVLKINSVVIAQEGESLVILHAPRQALAARRTQRICTSILGGEAEIRPSTQEAVTAIRKLTEVPPPPEEPVEVVEEAPEVELSHEQVEESMQRRMLDKEDYDKLPLALRTTDGVVLVKENEEDLVILHTRDTIRQARRLLQACTSYLHAEAHLKNAEALIIRSFQDSYVLREDPDEAAKIATGTVQDEASKTDIGRTVKDLIEHAATLNATDIHIESRARPSGAEEVISRYRVSGDLVEGPMKLSGGRGAQVANWLFSQGRRNNPQWVSHAMLDGVADVVIVDPEGQGMRQVQLRLANLPEVRGWDLILRILNTGQHAISLKKLGYNELQLELIQEAFARPYGIIVFSGPTGSGKSTSMMSALEVLPDNLKIISLEQPVERPLANTSHVTTRDEATLAKAIPSVNRWDGNITVLGELRDQPSARALKDFTTSGKLTVVTLHASNALTVPTRMAELTVEWSMLADPNFLVSLINQRLVAQLCPNCRVPLADNWDRVPRFRLADFEEIFAKPDGVFLRGSGCQQQGCRKGAIGRVLCAEVILIDDEDRSFIEKQDIREWRLNLLKRGWMPITSHALERCFAGQIDPILCEQAVGPLSGHTKTIVDYNRRTELLKQKSGAS